MNHIHLFLNNWVTVFNLVVLSYFFLGNGIYTILMLLSLRATWVHIRQMAYQGLDALRHSPLTPPVTIIIPAWNEQDVIVNSVRSALQADYRRPPGHCRRRWVNGYDCRPPGAKFWAGGDGRGLQSQHPHRARPRLLHQSQDSPTSSSSAKCGGASRMPSTPASTSAAHPTSATWTPIACSSATPCCG